MPRLIRLIRMIDIPRPWKHLHQCSIEFTGPPGSGKTRVEAELATKRRGYVDLAGLVSQSGERISDRVVGPLLRRLPLSAEWSESLVARSTDRHELLISFLVERPGILAALEDLVDMHRGARSTAMGLRWFFAHAYQWQLARSVLGDSTLLMAEGFAHRSLSFVDPTQPLPIPVLTRYLEVVPKPCLLVHLEIDEEEATRRLRKDGRYLRNRLATLTDEERAIFYSSMHRSSSAIAEVAEGIGWDVCRLQNRNLTTTLESVVHAHHSIGCSAS